MTELGDIYYHVDVTRYTPQEAMAIQGFMERDYQSFELPRSQRDGIFRIEIPNIPESKQVEELIEAIVPDELKSCHPLLRRRDKFVRFVPTLIEEGEEKTKVDGNILDIETSDGKTKYYIRIALDELEGMDGEDLAVNVAGIIVHELAETDYFLKSPEGTEDNKGNLGTDAYNLEEDEVVANRRTLGALRAKFPNAGFTIATYPVDEN